MRAALRRLLTLLPLWLLWLPLLYLAATGSTPGGGTVWEGWYTLLLTEERDLAEAHQLLSEAEGPRVISLINASARYQGFPDLETVPVRELSARFDPADPRYDPYLKSLERFFSTSGPEGAYHILMIERDRPTPQLLSLLRERLGRRPGRGWPATGEGWILLDALGANSIVLVTLFLVWAAGLLIFFPEVRLPGVALVASFIPFAATGAVGAVGAGLLLFGLLNLLRRSRQEVRTLDVPGLRRLVRSVRVSEFVPLLWAAIAVAALLIAAGEGASIAVMAVSSLLLAAGAFLLVLLADYLRYAAFEHHPFTPVRILTRRFGAPAPRPGMSATLWGAGGLLALVGVALLVPPIRTAPVPAPVEAVAAGVSYRSLRREFDPQSSLPTLSAYVAHRAFQETILYGGGYGVPQEGEQVALPTFDLVDGRLVEGEEVVVTFDQQWLESILSPEQSYPGVHSILLSQPGLSGVEQATFDRLYLANFQPAPLAGAVVFAFSPFFLFGLSVARTLGVRSTKREA